MPKGKYWIYNTKLELGSHNTDWSPHPEDYLNDVNKLKEDLEATNKAIEEQLALIRTKDIIDTVIDIVDNRAMYTERSLTRTEFISEIYGILNTIDEDLSKVSEGNGKWHVSVYDKEQFTEPTKLA